MTENVVQKEIGKSQDQNDDVDEKTTSVEDNIEKS